MGEQLTAIGIDPKFALAYYNRGVVYAKKAEHDRAIADNTKAIEIDPFYSIGYENVAWIYVYMNRPSDAEDLMRRAAEHKVEVIQFSFIRYLSTHL